MPHEMTKSPAKEEESVQPLSKPLPTPAERPLADIVIFDGHCRFCRRQVDRINRFDRRGRLAYLSLHTDEARAHCPDLSHDELMEAMLVLDRQGNRHGGAAAFRYLSRRLPALWPLAPLMHAPFCMPLWQWIYRQIGRRRYLWGRTDDCEEGCAVHFR